MNEVLQRVHIDVRKIEHIRLKEILNENFPYHLGYYIRPEYQGSTSSWICCNAGYKPEYTWCFPNESIDFIGDTLIPGRVCRVHKNAYRYMNIHQVEELKANNSLLVLYKEVDHDSYYDWECRIINTQRVVWVDTEDLEIVE